MTNTERSNLRNCYCGVWDKKPELYREYGYPEGFCGFCEVCKKPGHARHYPGPVPYTGAWCDECYQKEAEHAAKRFGDSRTG